MSIDSILSGVESITTTISGGVNSAVRAAADIGLGGVGSTGTYWAERLQTASFRGVPFGVLEGESQFGRKNVVHEYPYRDVPWVEDMGRGARVLTITGFLVENASYGGLSSVIAQRDQLIAAAESSADISLLSHPTFGLLKVNLVGPLQVREVWDRGRAFEIRFTVIESGERLFPSVASSTGDDVTAACSAADYAATQDFISAVESPLKEGAAVVQQAVTTAAQWGRKVQNLANDATNLINTVSTLRGQFGRFANGRNVAGVLGGAAIAQVVNSGATVQSLIAAGSAARSAVSAAVSTLATIVSGVSAS